MAELNTDVRFVRGVGEARAKSLAKLGITDLKSLISYFPRAYEDRRESRCIAELQVGERACVTAMVASEPKLSRIRKGLELVKLRVVDESAALELTYFNQSYLKNTFHVGESYTFYGTVEGTLLRRTMTNPVFEREGLHAVTGCIVPVYPLTAGVGQSLLHRAIRQGLDEGADRLPDLLPAELRRQHGLCDVRYAYENIHFPADDAALAAARYIVGGEAKKLFSFSLTPEACKQLDQVTEAFLMTQQERGFRTLDYYKQLRRQSFS